MTTTARRCQATNQRGKPCQAPAGSSGYCAFHDPAWAARRAEGRSSGGRARRKRAQMPALMPAAADDLAARLAHRSAPDADKG